jgi:hypothetical protein
LIVASPSVFAAAGNPIVSNGHAVENAYTNHISLRIEALAEQIAPLA